MWSRKRIPVATRALPRPSRFSRTRMSVSFVFRWSVAVLGIVILPVAPDFLHQPFHFVFRSNGNTHKSSAHVFRAFAQQNSAALESSEQFRPLRSEVRQQKVGRARVRAHAEPLQ